MPDHYQIHWSSYLQYRVDLRDFDRSKIERILRYGSERYFDIATGRSVVVGRHDERLVIIPYDVNEETITPVTIHTTTRQQINFRLKTGRFIYGK